MTVRAMAALFALLIQLPTNPAQQQQQAKALLEGTVLRSGSGEPLARAQVSLQRILQQPPPPAPGQPAAPITPPPQIPAALTEKDGKFSFKDLEPGQYRLRVARNGYATLEYGQRAVGTPGTTINLVEGQQMKDVAFRMIPSGIVTGHIRDANGEPVAGLQVSLMRSIYNVNGQRNLTNAGGATTDDRGEYRIFWVPSGRYLLSVGAASASTLVLVFNQNLFADRVFPVTYYPGVLDPSRASVLDLQPGAELGGIDVVLMQPTSYRIRGRVVDSATGRPPQSAGLSIVPRQEQGASGLVLTTTTTGSNVTYNNANGSFEIRNVIPGPYWLRASVSANLNDPINLSAVGNARTAMELLDSVLLNRTGAQVPIEVAGSDLEGVVVTLAPGIAIPMRLSVEGQELAAVGGYDRIRVYLQPTIPGAATANQRIAFDAAGAGVLDNISPGEYRLQISQPQPDFYLKEASFERTDVLNDRWQITSQTSGTLNVVLSNKAGQIEGNLVDALSQPVRGSAVLLIPEQGRDRPELYKRADTDQNGHFILRGIAPGGYKVFAWEAIEPNAWYDRQLLSQYESQGKPVRIQESSKETVEIKIIPAPK